MILLIQPDQFQKRADALKERGSKDVYCLFSHPVLSDNAVENLNKAGFKEIIFTNSIPLPDEKRLHNMKVLSIAPLFGGSYQENS